MERGPTQERAERLRQKVYDIIDQQWSFLPWQQESSRGLFGIKQVEHSRTGEIVEAGAYLFTEKITANYRFGRQSSKSRMISITEFAGNLSHDRHYEVTTDYHIDALNDELEVEQFLAPELMTSVGRQAYASEHYPSFGIQMKSPDEQWEHLADLLAYWQRQTQN